MDKVVETKNHSLCPPRCSAAGVVPALRCCGPLLVLGVSHRRKSPGRAVRARCGGGPGGAEQRSRLRCQSSVVPEPGPGAGALGGYLPSINGDTSVVVCWKLLSY